MSERRKEEQLQVHTLVFLGIADLTSSFGEILLNDILTGEVMVSQWSA